jgi:DNA-binding transcriptional LysR family regulator
MDLKSIRYFVAAAEQLHFGRAGTRMNVVQAAISQRIKHLEEELGLLLFERIGNAVALTEAGRQVLPECRKLLRLAEDSVRIARHAGQGGDGILRFAFVDNAVSGPLQPLLREFRARHPRVELTLESLDRHGQMAALDERIIDVGLMAEPVPEDRFLYQRFVAAPLVVVLPPHHRLGNRASLRIAELEHEPFVMFPATSRSRTHETILTACAAAGYTPYVAEEADRTHTCLALVDAGVGVTLLPSWVTKAGAHSVTFVPLADATVTFALAFVWRRDTKSTALTALLDVAQRIAKEIATATPARDTPLETLRSARLR